MATKKQYDDMQELAARAIGSLGSYDTSLQEYYHAQYREIMLRESKQPPPKKMSPKEFASRIQKDSDVIQGKQPDGVNG